MKFLGTTALVGMLLLCQAGQGLGQTRSASVFLLEDARANQWCAYGKEAPWKAAVQQSAASTVGSLTYVNKRLAQIDVTRTGESGDWLVYDHYFLDEHEQIVRLSRTINVLPGDRSVVQVFSIRDGEAKRAATTETQLSTGKPLSSPESVWLPELPILTRINMSPFSGLLVRSDLMTSSKSCISAR